jgi:hypothetical protein
MYATEFGMQDASAHWEHEQWEKPEAAHVKSQKRKVKQAMAEAAKRSKRKGKAIRPNSMRLIDTDFHRIRCKDFYADQERDIAGHLYWCIEHMHIRQDVYRSFRYPLRGMSVIDVDHLKRKPYFDDAL